MHVACRREYAVDQSPALASWRVHEYAHAHARATPREGKEAKGRDGACARRRDQPEKSAGRERANIKARARREKEECREKEE